MNDLMDVPDEWCREFGIVLRSGRGVREDRFSVDARGEVAQGYDHCLDLSEPRWLEARGLEGMSSAEWAEVAEVMITRWQAFKVRMETTA